MKETNLEHYKEELKKMFNEHYKEPSVMFSKIRENFNPNITVLGFGTCTNAILEWMAQPYKEPILNDSEKKYLGAIIRPFRNGVECIGKTRVYVDYTVMYSIRIVLASHTVVLPQFPKDSHMYKGMELQKEYTLEELGL